jgi:hypothetical protein
MDHTATSASRLPSTAGTPTHRRRRVDLVEVRGVGAVGDDREQLGALVRDVGEGELGELRQLLRRARNAHPEAVALVSPGR